MLRKFFDKSGISIKDFCIIFILLVNVLAWGFMSPTVIAGILEGITLEGINVTNNQEVFIWSAYYGGIVISSIIGSIIANKVDRFKFIYAWTAIGIVTSIVPILYSSFTWIDCLIISSLLGSSFGLGIPSCLSYFADITQVENRGRIGGIILLTVYIATSILAIKFRAIDVPTNLVVFAGWRSLGLIVFFLQPNQKISSSERKSDGSFSGIIKDKTFGFYILAWMMFNLVDVIGGPIVINSLGEISEILIITNPILASITAIIAGIAADKIGRKKIVLYGFISLGVAYAIFGIAPTDPFVGYFFVVINGITMGLFFLTFILLLWGDISQSGSREKYYALGVLPFFLTYIIGMALEWYILQIPDTSIFSVAAFFLFLAVLPLLYVSETLPEKKMELRRLRSFAEEARKAKEKYERKKSD